MAVPALGASCRLSVALFPPPLYLELDPCAGPRSGPSSPPAVVARRWPAGAAVRVSGQRLAGCGAVGSPRARCLRPPSRGRWRALLRDAVPWGGRG